MSFKKKKKNLRLFTNYAQLRSYVRFLQQTLNGVHNMKIIIKLIISGGRQRSVKIGRTFWPSNSIPQLPDDEGRPIFSTSQVFTGARHRLGIRAHNNIRFAAWSSISGGIINLRQVHFANQICTQVPRCPRSIAPHTIVLNMLEFLIRIK